MRRNRLLGAATGALVLLATLAVVTASPASATTFVVTTADDGESVPGVSLREAVISANGDDGADTVQLQDDTVYFLDDCANSWLVHTDDANLTVEGNGSTIVQTCDNQRIFEHDNATGSLILTEMTLTGGAQGGGGAASSDNDMLVSEVVAEDNSAANGGAFYSQGDLFVIDSTIRDNHSSPFHGGGLLSSGDMTISGSTISGNTSFTEGGGVYVGGDLTVSRSTITQNLATGNDGGTTGGGGIRSFGTTTIESSTIVANTSPAGQTGSNIKSSGLLTVEDSILGFGSGGEDCRLGGPGSVDPDHTISADSSCQLNLSAGEANVHPMIGVLADNGGDTLTRRTVTPSPALNLYAAPCTPTTDQRGTGRATGGCDAGAFDGTPQACVPTFSDVSGSHPFFDEICWLSQMGISTGFQDGTYKPSAAVTRQSMSAFLYRLALAPAFDPGFTVSFEDVGQNHPFFTEIEWMSAEGIAQGFESGEFGAGLPVTRQSMAAFLFRMAGEPNEGNGPQLFSDVSPGHPFYEEIQWLANHDVAEGFLDGTFRPGTAVSRQAMAAFMLRMADEVLLFGI
jgi:hypothetical protein